MVGIVIVSHCNKMCENLINFLDVFKTSDFELVNGCLLYTSPSPRD